MRNLKTFTHRGVVLRVGMSITTGRNPKFMGARPGERLSIETIRDDGNRILFGVRGNSRDGWHELDGAVNHHEGYWLQFEEVLRDFNLEGSGLKFVKCDLMFKKRNLRGMNCTVLAILPDGSYIVEFEENIGGISCDGLGKSGCCLPVSSAFLSDHKKEDKIKNIEKEKHEVISEAEAIEALQVEEDDGVYDLLDHDHHDAMGETDIEL